jgi:hypothetical protein
MKVGSFLILIFFMFAVMTVSIYHREKARARLEGSTEICCMMGSYSDCYITFEPIKRTGNDYVVNDINEGKVNITSYNCVIKKYKR